jgi:outer membrane protein assembly factor BamB
MKRHLLTIAFLAAAAPLAACSQAQSGGTLTWAMYQNGTTHNAVLPLDFPAVSWSRDVHAKINGGLAYDGRYLYAVDFDDELMALDPKDGTIAWRARADDVLMSTPIVAEGMVFVGSGTNAVLYDRPTGTVWGAKNGNHWLAFRTGDGREVWSYPTVGEAMPSAAYLAGQLIFATGDNLATAVVAATGKPVWTAPIPGVPTMGSTMVHDGYAFFTTTLGKSMYDSPTRNHTIALGTTDGKQRWSVPYGNSDCTPTVAQGMVFVEGVTDGPIGPREAWGTNDVSALDEQSGALRWHYLSPKGPFTAVGSNERGITGTYEGGVLYQAVPVTNSMIAFRAADGRILWQMHTTAPVKMSPVIAGGKVFFGDTVGMFYVLDAKTGETLQAVPYDKPYATSPPVIVGGTLFVANNDTIRAFPLNKL